MKEEIKELFKLQVNPFGKEFQQALSLDVDPSHYTRVDGFGEVCDQIESWFPGLSDHEKVLLVHGGRQTGRTSVINYVIRKFCVQNELLDGSKIDESLVRIVRAKCEDEDDSLLIKEVLREIYFDFDDRGIDFDNDQNFKKLGEEFSKYILDLDYGQSVPGSGRLESIFRKSISKLKDDRLKLVLIVEDVNNLKQVISCLKILRGSALIIFSTSKKKLYQEFVSEETWEYKTIQLTELKEDHVLKFVEERWSAISRLEKHPFDMTGLSSLFKGKILPFKTVIKILDKIFQEHIDKLNDKSELANSDCSISSEAMLDAAWRSYGPGGNIKPR